MNSKRWTDGASNPGGTEKVPQRQPGQEDAGGKPKGPTPTEAPNASFETGAGAESTGFDSPGVGSQTLSNEEYLALEKSRARATTTGDTGDGIEAGDASHEAE